MLARIHTYTNELWNHVRRVNPEHRLTCKLGDTYLTCTLYNLHWRVPLAYDTGDNTFPLALPCPM